MLHFFGVMCIKGKVKVTFLKVKLRAFKGPMQYLWFLGLHSSRQKSWTLFLGSVGSQLALSAPMVTGTIDTFTLHIFLSSCLSPCPLPPRSGDFKYV